MFKSKLYRPGRFTGIGGLCIAALLFFSCNDFLDVDPKHAASEEQQWNTLEEVRAGLMGIYGLMRAALSENNTHWIAGDVRMGDFTVYERTDLAAVRQNNLNYPASLLEEVADWRRFYAVINAASVFIEKAPRAVEEDKSYTPENLRLDLAQARMVRAFCYFYMVRMWGDLPLITEAYDNGSFPEIPSTDAATILNYVKGEVTEILSQRDPDALPFKLGTNNNKYYGVTPDNWRGRLFNRISAYALLAHIAAWEGNYATALSYTGYILGEADTDVIQTNSYSSNLAQIDARYMTTANLVSTTGLFAATTDNLRGAVIIGFTSLYDNQESTATGHLESLTLADPLVRKPYPDIYISRDSLYSIFPDREDERFGYDAANLQYSTRYIYGLNLEPPIFSKINIVKKDGAKDNNWAVFSSALVFTRPEELATLHAEALVAVNEPEKALEWLNKLRANRGLGILSYKVDFQYEPMKLLQEIAQERRRELMGEGWRWYDRIRYARLMNNDPEMTRLINEGGIYWPLSAGVLSANTKLSQNRYWK